MFAWYILVAGLGWYENHNKHYLFSLLNLTLEFVYRVGCGDANRLTFICTRSAKQNFRKNLLFWKICCPNKTCLSWSRSYWLCVLLRISISRCGWEGFLLSFVEKPLLPPPFFLPTRGHFPFNLPNPKPLVLREAIRISPHCVLKKWASKSNQIEIN